MRRIRHVNRSCASFCFQATESDRRWSRGAATVLGRRRADGSATRFDLPEAHSIGGGGAARGTAAAAATPRSQPPVGRRRPARRGRRSGLRSRAVVRAARGRPARHPQGAGLYANLRPARVWPGLEAAGPLKPEVLAGTDMLDRARADRRACTSGSRAASTRDGGVGAQHDALLARGDRAHRARRLRRAQRAAPGT